MKVLVNKCPHTGTLFECDKAYSIHMREIGKERRAKAKAQKIKDNWKEWLADEKSKIIHPDQIIPWFLENFDHIKIAFNNGVRASGISFWLGDKIYDTDSFNKLNFNNLKYSTSVSNTHNCPNNGVTNFMCKSNRPNGYPGWHGHIDGSITRLKSKSHSFPFSSLLNLVDIKTGGGSGGNNSWHYSVILFLADWPGLQHEVDIMEQDKIVNRLKGIH